MTLAFSTPHITVYQGDVRTVLADLPDESVDCCVTSPPYWGLRDYGTAGQLGLERTPDEYTAACVDVFRGVRRVLKDAATLWLNLGDSYAAGGNGGGGKFMAMRAGKEGADGAWAHRADKKGWRSAPPGLKAKDLVGIPWMVAFALRADGWYLRSDIVWSKPNPMPESVTDRPTKSHEYVFLLSKSPRYWYDAAAIREPLKESSVVRMSQDVEAQEGSWRANGGEKTNGPMKAVRRTDKQRGHSRRHEGFNDRWDAMEKSEQQQNGANARSVWTIAPQNYSDAHFATFPAELPRRAILAGCPADGVVLDPFAGSGTTLAVARDLGRKSIGIELNPEYVRLIEKRCGQLALELPA